MEETFVPDYTPGIETKCDMCFGTGHMQTYVHDDGSQVWATTDENWTLPEDARTSETRCSTCGGTGIMPEYLKPAYWKQRIDEQHKTSSESSRDG